MDEIFSLLNDVHTKVFNKPMEVTMNDLNSMESLEKFNMRLE